MTYHIQKPTGDREPSYLATVRLSKRGLSQEAIAAERKLDPKTIYSHLCKYRRRLRELAKTGSPVAVTESIEALQCGEWKVRECAVRILGNLRDRRAVQPLIDLLSHESGVMVRWAAVTALGRIGGRKSRSAAPDDHELRERKLRRPQLCSVRLGIKRKKEEGILPFIKGRLRYERRLLRSVWCLPGHSTTVPAAMNKALDS